MAPPQLLEVCWRALGGEPSLCQQLEPDDRDAWLGGSLAVDDLAIGAVRAELLAAAEPASEAKATQQPGSTAQRP